MMSWLKVKKNAGLVERVSDKNILIRSFHDNLNAFKRQVPALLEGKEFLTENAVFLTVLQGVTAEFGFGWVRHYTVLPTQRFPCH